MNQIYKLFVFCVGILIPVINNAQCVICRTQVVNNVSQGDTSLAAGLNTGIIYLFVTPYIAIGVVAFLWYRNSKVNERKRSFTGNH